MIGRLHKENFSKRLLSIDIIRGLAIIGILFFHPLVYGVWHTEANALSIIHPFVVVAFFPIIVLLTWGGGFLLISGVVNSYNIYLRLKRGLTFKDASLPVILNSAFLLLISPIRGVIFHRTQPAVFTDGHQYTFMSSLIERGELILPDAELFFKAGGILHSIAFGGFLSVILLYFLFKNEGIDKIKRNSIVLLIVAFLWMSIYQPISNLIGPYGNTFYAMGGAYRFLTLLIHMFFGQQLSFFPMGIYTVFGMIAGYMIACKIEFKWIKRYGYGLGSLFLLSFFIHIIIDIIIDFPLMNLLSYLTYPLELLFFSLGCMLLFFPGLVKKIEYASQEEKIRIAKRSLFIRRFGVATLTLYIIEGTLNTVLSSIFHKIFGQLNNFNQPNAFMTNVPAILLFVLTYIVFWFIFVYFWSKIGYKFGFEHLGIVLTKPFRKEKTNRLNLYIPDHKQKNITPNIEDEQ